MSLLESVVFVATRLGAVAVLAASAYILGRAGLDRLGLAAPRRSDLRQADRQRSDWRSSPTTAALATTVGLGLLSQGAFFAGLLGGFRPPVLITLLALANLSCLGTWRRELRRLTRRGLTPSWGYLVFPPLFLWALFPPLGWDATAYHLPYVRAFLEAGHPAFVAHLRYPVFPQATETLFLLAWIFGGDVAAKLTQTLALLLVAGLLLDWGRCFFSPRVGVWAAALWLGTPLAVWLGTLAYVDVQLTLFTVGTVYAWWSWRHGESAADPSRWLWVAGFLAGMAAGTKYLGLFFCLALGVMSLGRGLQRRTLRPAVLFSLAAVLTFGPWYARIVWHTGNPVFPFYAPIFGESEWTTRHDRVVFGDPAEAASRSAKSIDPSANRPLRDAGEDDGHGGALPAPLARLISELGLLARLPWSGVFERGAFFSVAPLTPWYLVLLPVGLLPLVFVRGAPAMQQARSLTALVFFYALFWLSIEHDLRFLLPALPLLNVVLAAGLYRMSPLLRRRRAARAVTLMLIAPGLLYCAYKLWHLGPLPVTSEGRSDFLEARIPGYGGMRWLNENRGSDYTVYGLYASRLRHYADGQLLGDTWGPLGYRRVAVALRNPRALAAELREIGADFLFLDRRWAKSPLTDDARFRRFFAPVWSEGPYLILELRTEDGAAPALPAQSR